MDHAVVYMIGYACTRLGLYVVHDSRPKEDFRFPRFKTSGTGIIETGYLTNVRGEYFTGTHLWSFPQVNTA